MNKATLAYIETLLWSECDDDGNSLDDNYGVEDVSDEAIAQIEADIEGFMSLVDELGYGACELMHDFVLTRNRHGAGFWDGDYGDDGDVLTVWAHSMGEMHAYAGSDGKIYVQ